MPTRTWRLYCNRSKSVLNKLLRRSRTTNDQPAALDRLAELAKEKEEAIEAARHSALTTRAFGLYWTLRNDEALKAAGVEAISLVQEADALFDRFPNAALNADEQRRLRAALYHPLLAVEERNASELSRPYSRSC